VTTFAAFEERGYRVEAFMPGSANEPRVWTIRVTRRGELVREATVRMTHEPRFGPDAGDVQALEEETDRLLATLP